MFDVEPKKFGVKFKYETQINGNVQTLDKLITVTAYDIIDAIMIIKNDVKYVNVSEPVVYEVYEINEDV